MLPSGLPGRLLRPLRGRTSEPQAGQWNTPSGRLHMQAPARLGGGLHGSTKLDQAAALKASAWSATHWA